MTARQLLERDLTPADFEVLEFERAWWKYQGRKTAVIRERFGITHTRYLQRLNAIVDHPQAPAYNPQLVRQILSTRNQRAGQRSALVRGVDV